MTDQLVYLYQNTSESEQRQTNRHTYKPYYPIHGNDDAKHALVNLSDYIIKKRKLNLITLFIYYFIFNSYL